MSVAFGGDIVSLDMQHASNTEIQIWTNKPLTLFGIKLGILVEHLNIPTTQLISELESHKLHISGIKLRYIKQIN